MKFVLPGVWLIGFTAATTLMFTGGFSNRDGSPPPLEMKWLFLAGTVVGGLCLYWCCMRLKRVEVDEEWLYVSNFVREIRVPLGEVEAVSENRWINIRPVTVEVRRDTDFGSRIIFMPQTRIWWFWQAHPVVGELQAAVRRARGLPPEPPAA